MPAVVPLVSNRWRPKQLGLLSCSRWLPPGPGPAVVGVRGCLCLSPCLSDKLGKEKRRLPWFLNVCLCRMIGLCLSVFVFSDIVTLILKLLTIFWTSMLLCFEIIFLVMVQKDHFFFDLVVLYIRQLGTSNVQMMPVYLRDLMDWLDWRGCQASIYDTLIQSL